ncbi:MAG: gliding motility-associated ABC transporter substrate-binding protein GldG [Saprospiraceae bacterium]
MKGFQNIIQLIIIITIIIVVNIIANFYYSTIDLTEEKRHTLSSSTKSVIDQVDDVMYIKVLLAGDFPSGFKRLQNATKDLLEEFSDMNPNIEYIFDDPLEGDQEDVIKRRDQLSKDGIIPIALKFFDGKEYIQKAMYPYALISYHNRNTKISLVKEQTIGEDEEVTLNKSIERLEYKFTNLFQKLNLERKQNIAFSIGNGEVPYERTIRLETELKNHYNTGRLNLDSLIVIDQALDLLIIAGPTKAISDKSKFKIDQYIMNGGKVMWFIEKLDANLDSISQQKFYIPHDIVTGVDDLLFKYGVRIQPNLVLDLEASSIPQVVGQQNGKPQTMQYKWFYHPLALPNQNHPIGKNIDRVNLFFPSSIETIKTKTNVTKTPILTSSPYSRHQLNPVRLNFEILKYPPKEKQFNKGKQTLGMLLEGEFESAYKNRVNKEFKEGLDQVNIDYKEKSISTKQILFTDVDFIKNFVNHRTKSAEPIGYNKWEQKVYEGNRDFILNAVEYMLDDNNVLDSRSKQVKLRLLDAVKTKNEKSKWQFFNLGLPLIFLAFFGLLFNLFRRRRYR